MTSIVRADVDPARALLHQAVTDRVFPAAVAEVGDRSGVLWREAFGRLTFDDDAPSADEWTIFDLASLTKPMVTAAVAMELVAAKAIDLETPLAECFAEWRGADRVETSIRDLLEHSSGLAARLLDPPPVGRREFEHEIAVMPLEYVSRTQAVYSDLGFILLGFALEDRGGRPLADMAAEMVARMAKQAPDDRESFLAFQVPNEKRGVTAPTEPLKEDRRCGTRLMGVVHDNYAAALGGVAGHAGLFGNVAAVGLYARVVLRAARGDASFPPPFTPRSVARMARKSDVPGSSRALGWDTMLPTSSCGAGMSPAAFGHVGYTGTSLWIDPILDRYFVLLTNRACGGGTLDEMRTVRRAFHDALVTLDS